MLKQLVSIALMGLLLNVLAAVPATAQNGEAQNQKIQEIKNKVRELGVGKDARVEVTLRDGRKLKGHIGEVSEDHFSMVDRKSGAVISINYSEVTKLRGTNGLTAKKVAVNVGKGAAIVAGVAGAFALLMWLIIPRT